MGCSPWGHKELAMTERLTHTYIPGNGNTVDPCVNMGLSFTGPLLYGRANPPPPPTATPWHRHWGIYHRPFRGLKWARASERAEKCLGYQEGLDPTGPGKIP